MGANLLDNTMRGILGEFIVASALGITEHRRKAWRMYDLEFQKLKIEVKSASYIQSWYQKDYSKISFSIAPSLAWDEETNILNGPSKRQSDLYVFCILETKEIEKIDPLDLNQWVFYLVPSKELNEKFLNQKTLSEGSLKKLGTKPIKYGALKEAIIECINVLHKENPIQEV